MLKRKQQITNTTMHTDETNNQSKQDNQQIIIIDTHKIDKHNRYKGTASNDTTYEISK